MIELILIIMGCAVFGYTIANEELFYYLKKFFKVDKVHPILLLLSAPKVYKKILKTYQIVLLFPLILISIASSLVIRLIIKVLNCYICSTFWLTLCIALMLTSYTLPFIILISFTSVFVSSTYNLIRNAGV